ncbi:MAG TPA: hypothetical protein PLN63_10520, partial [Paludibacteraceae bacterium]|nr:hypothetical protein [Paludibacteraceae bacterium]HOU69700.1 hypothetical protein [Paludibacteraceae bacterium]HPH64030.1 hypothetical protein [Paludibacteraceae bacterium]HQF51300.1 hypothetical protein [Paludibacteraceae bacterium]
RNPAHFFSFSKCLPDSNNLLLIFFTNTNIGTTNDRPKHPFIAEILVRKFTDNNNYQFLKLILNLIYPQAFALDLKKPQRIHQKRQIESLPAF